MNLRNPKTDAVKTFSRCFGVKRLRILQVEDLRNSLRSYVARIYFNGGFAARETVILKRSFLANLRLEAQILLFFQKHRLFVPAVLGFYPEEGILVLEDLGSSNLENMSRTPHNLRQALSLMCRIHASGVWFGSELKQIFSEFRPLQSADVASSLRNLTQIQSTRLCALFPWLTFSLRDRQRMSQLLMAMLDDIVQTHPSSFDPNQANHLIINDLKPHHFIYHHDRFKLIDLENVSAIGLPQVDLVALLEHPAVQLSKEQKEDWLNFYLKTVARLTPAHAFDPAGFKKIYDYYRFILKLFLVSISREKNTDMLYEFKTVPIVHELLAIVKP